MSLLGRNWIEESTNEEKYNSIFGIQNTQGKNNIELIKDIEKSIDDNYTTKLERKQLLKLQQEINIQNNNQ